MHKTIIIIGASDGIGALTAKELAAPDVCLVLAARGPALLHSVAEECKKRGARVCSVVADVSSTDDTAKISSKAITEFGSIDAWINMAGVAQTGRFIDTPEEDFRRVMEINFHGVVNGSRMALEQFEKQGFGTLINASSVLGMVATPNESAYVSSKFAVRGFTAAIRQEYRLTHPDIHVCCVMPATMNTAIYDKGSNYSGKTVRLIPPVYKPELVARTIKRLLHTPKGEVVVGGAGMLLSTTSRWLPNITGRLFPAYVNRLHFDTRQAEDTSGTLYSATTTSTTKGRFALPTWADTFFAVFLFLGAVRLYRTRRQR